MLNILLILVPISLALEYLVHAPPIWVFLTAVVAIVPLANWVRHATEELAVRAGPAIGGLLNVTFGNMTELILAIFVLKAGQVATAKAQITGSLIGNSLLGLGIAALVGGIGREKQTFNKERVSLLGSLLVLVVIALMVPAAFDYTERNVRHIPNPSQLDERMSLGVAVVLILLYLANLIYTFITHRDIYSPGEEANPEDVAKAWPVWKSLAVLLGATVVVAIESELVSGALESTAKSMGVTEFFLGVTLLAVIGNASEYISAAYFARQNRMGLVMSITLGATIQVGLLIAPLLVIIGALMGHPMSLVFNSPLELIAIAGIAFAVNSISQDGETTWFEGVFLLGIYLILGIAFYFVTP